MKQMEGHWRYDMLTAEPCSKQDKLTGQHLEGQRRVKP